MHGGMGFFNQAQAKLGGLGVYAFARWWMSAIDGQVLFYDRTVDPSDVNFDGPNVYIFWHEYILAPFFSRGHCNIAMLISRHRDAEWLAQAARHMGFETIRGSTQRGGESALREMLRQHRQMNLAITPDGPRGPRRWLSPGCIFVAAKQGIPIVPFGIGYDRPWRMHTWDRFALPRPYSRLRVIVGPRLWFPAEMDRDEISLQRERVEGILNRLTCEAEHWAASGERREQQQPIRVQSMPWEIRSGGMQQQPVPDVPRILSLPSWRQTA
jgi:lysophospholipid acyltransferase (LPLAT)-like uncharacterized protein